MLRNKELRFYFASLFAVLVTGTVISYSIDPRAGLVALIALLLTVVISGLFSYWRYRQIGKLSNYLKRITGGDYSLDIRDNAEGELSILKNEIFKVTVTLREQAEQLKKDKRFLADSISDISHQLKTPITSMRVMTELLGDENLPREKRAEFTQNIRSQLERLQWLVTSLLKLSRMDAGTIEFRKETVDVRSMLTKAVEPLLIPMEIKNQALEISGDERTRFTGDLNWSAEAVTNVIKNCVEHTPQGGKISIQFGETPIHTWIAIQDNGEGIHPDDLPHIFDRFYRGRKSHKDSIGIGLAMSKSILLNQGGAIEANSEPGRGALFTIKIYKSIV
ncbi:signal transduction histidine kinase [Longilinea arvoryzae]|uniref:histidine kinase n=1 Tax=Longilinea arvoryzae TaxID=360412 RepID=A0A0S7BN50_9CHLR|nr:HAMP domain-containing sensor histidine kinase [Longilinea arvoryzae]GAP15393.1 signal transduction histidine kinase [Longilinea arvoryzae]